MSDKEFEWIKLDNAAKIYPAAMSKKWTPMFRLSATLREPVDPPALQAALARTLKRFPTFALRLKNGLFWHYFEWIDGVPEIQEDYANPCVRMDFRENGGFLFRVRYFERRIAVEFFHVLTDGSGGLCFLSTLVAEYLSIRFGAAIPRGELVLDCDERPKKEEADDSFMRFARKQTASRFETPTYTIKGTPGEKYYTEYTTGTMSAAAVKAKAKEYGATVTEFLTSVLLLAVCDVQRTDPSKRRRNMPVKVSVPVNLRKYYPTHTLRNFSSYVNIGIEPRYGRYTLAETIKLIKGYLAVETNEKLLNAKITANVASEKNHVLRVTPLFMKNLVLRTMFVLTGDRYCTTTLSNLGVVTLPAEMQRYVERLVFMLGAPSENPVNAAAVTCGDELCLSFSRRITEPYIERLFFTSLVRMGIKVKVESNRRG